MVTDNYLALRTLAEQFWDLQELRKACNNRIERGEVPVALLKPQLELLDEVEEVAAKDLLQQYRVTISKSIRAWQRSNSGIGEHLLARLLGVVGDPAVAEPSGWEEEGSELVWVEYEPYDRTVRELWAYCGHGDPTRRRRKGMDLEDAMGCGNPRAKTLVYLLAVSCMKQRSSKYRTVYDKGRKQYRTRQHDGPCVRCGPAGRPAKAGSAWSDAHQHAAALRLTGKAILKDLWRAAQE